MGKTVLLGLSAVLLLGLAGAALTDAAPGAKNEPASLDTDPHLVGRWTFDGASGTTAADASKHGHNGSLKGGLAFEKDSAAGRLGKALKLDGKDGMVEVTGYKGVSGVRPRTVAAWIKTKSSRGEIMSWGQDDFGKMFIFGFIRGRIGLTPGGGYLYMNDPVNDDAWHHVAVVVVETKRPNLHDHVKLYKDGEPAAIHDIGLLDLWPVDTGAALDLRIGRRFGGLIDDVRLYDRPLSGDEIKALVTQKKAK